MEQIKLTLLAEDIKLNNYTNALVCPITKALHRAGHTNLYDKGFIGGFINGQYVHISSWNNNSYIDLVVILFGMLNSIDNCNVTSVNGIIIKPEPILIADFSHILDITV